MLALEKLNANLLVALDLMLQERSVARAAARQGVTPSAMSHSLRALRELFEDPLLVRSARGMAPTPLAEQLAEPLRRALRDLERAVTRAPDFDPASSRRAFVLSAPDFISTLLLGPLMRMLAEEAPRAELEIRPIARRGRDLLPGEVWMLAEGNIDLALGAELGDVPGLVAQPIYHERFVCLVRKGHPTVGRKLTLQRYAELPHALISITDERTPTWIDRALAEQGLSREIRVRTRYFMAAPLLVAQSDLVLTCPFQLARYFAARIPLRVLEPPIELPVYREFQAWHERFDTDPALIWLRGLVQRAAAEATAEN